MNQRSVLDDLGEDITGVAWPVSICMALTIFLVRVLNPGGASSASTVYIASAGYNENQHSDASSSQKLGGALLNAVIFIAVIVAMTFILVLLFKYECYRVIFAYMGFAMANIFFLITGLLIVLLCQTGNVHVDSFSLVYILFNFSVVGTLGTLFMPVPLLMKQCYMVWTGVIVAYIFTWIPDWTSWVLLVAMALYDIAAVLIPGGPLKWLVELAIERQQALPALVYESRPQGGYRGAGHWQNRGNQGVDPAAAAADGAAPGGGMEQPQQQEMSTRVGTPDSSTDSRTPLNNPPRGATSSRFAPQATAEATTAYSARNTDNGVLGSEVMEATSFVDPGSPQQRQQQLRQPSPFAPGGGRGSGGRPLGEGVEGSDVATLGQAMGGHVKGSSVAGRAVGEGTEGATAGAVALGRRLLGGGARGGGGGGGGGGRAVGEGADPGGGRGWDEPLVGGSAADTDSPRLPVYRGGVPPPGAVHQRDSSDSGSAASLLPHQGGQYSQGGQYGQEQYGQGGQYSQYQRGSGSESPAPARRGGPGGGSNSGNASVTAVVMGLASNTVRPEPGPAAGQQQAGAPAAAEAGEGAPVPGDGQQQEEEEEGGLFASDGVKLGLGDFIFYSMLVGKAAMYDMMTVYASFIGIIAGLGFTLLALAIFKRALPALPFSIALGVSFYFITRIVVEPFVTVMITTGAYY